MLVEGIPGSGKSTIAKKIKEYLNLMNIDTVLFSEGDAHPADLAWCVYIPIIEYKDIINKYSQYSQIINANSVIDEDFAVVAYTKLGLEPSENVIIKYLKSYEVYDGRVTLEKFTDLHLKRWRQFADKAMNENSISVFECVFFQNHICELMGIRNKDKDYISNHLISLIRTVEKLNPLMIYLSQPDVSKTIQRVSKERASSDKSKHSDWIDLVIDWVEKSQYGKKHGLKGFDGTIQFFEERKKVELEIYGKMPIDKYIYRKSGL